MEPQNVFQAFTYPTPSGFGQLPLKEGEKVILVTNDDGYMAKGINCLIESLRGLGRIFVVAPDSPRSGFSASFTAHSPIRLKRISDDGEVAVYACTGTPVDCVKLAFHRFFHDRKPDLVVSGINHGGNDSICVMYSGTMGAVFEACVVGVPAVGYSLLDVTGEADFSAAVAYTRSITADLLANPMPKGVVLNVNIPKTLDLKGVRVCRQGVGQWINEFHYIEGDENSDEAVFQVTGEYNDLEPDATDNDQYWMRMGYVSVVPESVDYTHHSHISTFKYLEK